MTTVDSQLLADIKALSVEEKLLLVEWILSNLHKSDPEIDKLWSVEAERRLDAYKKGEITSVSLESVLYKYK
ncbi:hypothetical protein RIVM261_091480 [Rivularia sp. IAM M-261]|nr:hypothetical protein RIVM261_091480 [Rivularia sp. IAM M-261]